MLSKRRRSVTFRSFSSDGGGAAKVLEEVQIDGRTATGWGLLTLAHSTHGPSMKLVSELQRASPQLGQWDYRVFEP